MVAKTDKPREGVQADINITPLVDVCLVLLIIFMVVTPMINDGVGVALPQTGRPARLPEDHGAKVVAIRADGRVYLGAHEVGLASLTERLRETMSRSEVNVVVRGDRALPYAQVRSVLKAINQAGVSRVALVTLRRGQGPAA